MKLTDFLTDTGRPVAYFPKLKKLTGSTTATILLCQFIYWRGKEKDPNGWLYKDSDEIEEETGLSYNEQKTARKKLRDAGLLKEHYARLDHQMRFLIDIEAINDKWVKLHTNVPESDDSTFGKNEMSPSLKPETTTETTTEIKDSPTETPKQKSDYVLAMEELEQHFSRQRNTPLPDWSSPKTANKLWRTPLKKVWTACNENVPLSKSVISQAITNMRRDKLTFICPLQIETVALSIIADKGNNHGTNNQGTFNTEPTAQDIADARRIKARMEV